MIYMNEYISTFTKIDVSYSYLITKRALVNTTLLVSKVTNDQKSIFSPSGNIEPAIIRYFSLVERLLWTILQSILNKWMQEKYQVEYFPLRTFSNFNTVKQESDNPYDWIFASTIDNKHLYYTFAKLER